MVLQFRHGLLPSTLLIIHSFVLKFDAVQQWFSNCVPRGPGAPRGSYLTTNFSFTELLSNMLPLRDTGGCFNCAIHRVNDAKRNLSKPLYLICACQMRNMQAFEESVAQSHFQETVSVSTIVKQFRHSCYKHLVLSQSCGFGSKPVLQFCSSFGSADTTEWKRIHTFCSFSFRYL
jgi:hypothetical protein